MARSLCQLTHYSWMVTIFSVPIQVWHAFRELRELKRERWLRISAHATPNRFDRLNFPSLFFELMSFSIFIRITTHDSQYFGCLTGASRWRIAPRVNERGKERDWEQRQEQQVRSDCQINWVIRILLLLLFIFYLRYALAVRSKPIASQ